MGSLKGQLQALQRALQGVLQRCLKFLVFCLLSTRSFLVDSFKSFSGLQRGRWAKMLCFDVRHRRSRCKWSVG